MNLLEPSDPWMMTMPRPFSTLLDAELVMELPYADGNSCFFLAFFLVVDQASSLFELLGMITVVIVLIISWNREVNKLGV